MVLAVDHDDVAMSLIFAALRAPAELATAQSSRSAAARHVLFYMTDLYDRSPFRNVARFVLLMFQFCEPARLTRLSVIVVCIIFSAAGNAQAPAGMSRAEVYGRAEALTELGRRMFIDPSLSASGKMSCASCHSALDAFGPPNALSVQPGGGDMRQFGVRAVPSLRYLQATPQFSEHFFESDDAADDSIDNGPTGGLAWDGRVDRGRDQARIPLLSAFEMANRDPADFVGNCGERPTPARSDGSSATPCSTILTKPLLRSSKHSRYFSRAPPNSTPTAANTMPISPTKPS